MAKLGIGLTFEQMKSLPDSEQSKLFAEIKSLRKAYKAVNYSAVYGDGAPKLAHETGMEVSEAKMLLKTF